MQAVLVIDPDPSSAKLTRVLLEEAGCTVLVAATTDAALQLLHLVHPRLVVTELSPEHLTENVGALRLAVLDAPIVAVTSLDSHSYELRAYTAGCSGFIHKPIDITTFASRVLTYLGDDQ